MGIKFKLKKVTKEDLSTKINEQLINADLDASEFIQYGYDPTQEKSVLDWIVFDKNIGILTEKVETGVVNLKISYGGNVAAIRVTKDNLDHVGDDFYIVVLKLLEIA